MNSIQSEISFSFRSEYKQMLKQRKTGPFDEQLSPDDEHFLSKIFEHISAGNSDGCISRS